IPQGLALCVYRLFLSCAGDVRKPAKLVLRFTLNNFEITSLNLLGNWPSTSTAHRDAIDRTNRSDFGGRSREEDFVRNVEHFSRDDRFDNGNRKFFCNRDDGVPRDAGEHRSA